MTEPIDLRAELDRAATRNEPPLTLDTDLLVAAGHRRLRRHRAARGAGVAAAAVGVLAVPTLVFVGPGIGVDPLQAGRGGAGSTIEPTPGAPHGGCRGETKSGSTEAYAMAQWLQPRLPTRQQYHTDQGWQVAYRNNCVDGAHQDSNDVGFRVRTHAGDIEVTTARNNPAERIAQPCRPADSASAAPAAPGGAPVPGEPTTTGTPAAGTSGSAVSVETLGPDGNWTPTVLPPGAVFTPSKTVRLAEPDRGQTFTICRTQPQPGGGTLTIEESRWPGGPSSSRGFPAVSRTVALWRPDGTVVTVIADNRDVSDTPPAAQPPMTIDEMVALVKSPGLQLHIPHPR
jgi:hypothetical protein